MLHTQLDIDTNFYPRPPRGGRRYEGGLTMIYPDISIHALREEGDYAAQEQFWHVTNFYPRPPRGGRLRHVLDGSRNLVISIHALREEGDSSAYPM